MLVDVILKRRPTGNVEQIYEYIYRLLYLYLVTEQVAVVVLRRRRQPSHPTRCQIQHSRLHVVRCRRWNWRWNAHEFNQKIKSIQFAESTIYYSAGGDIVLCLCRHRLLGRLKIPFARVNSCDTFHPSRANIFTLDVYYTHHLRMSAPPSSCSAVLRRCDKMAPQRTRISCTFSGWPPNAIRSPST